MTLTSDEIRALSESIAVALAKQLGATEKDKLKPTKKSRKDYIKVQVQNKEPLAPTYKIKTPKMLKQEKLKAEAEAKLKDKEEKARVHIPCSICGELFNPTSKINTVCSSKTCKMINKYDRIIEKHSNLRMKELGDENIE